MDSPLNETIPHEIQIGKGSKFLVFKLSSRPYLYIMPTCTQDEFFDESSFSCELCRPAHHSFGLQMDKCAPCNTLWMESKNDELESAIYD